MAAVANAFAALNAIGSGQAPAASKKKKDKKPKAPAAPEEAGEAAPVQVGVVDVGEACAVLDRSARTFRSGSDRVKLWKDWMKQVRRARDGEGLCGTGSRAPEGHDQPPRPPTRSPRRPIAARRPYRMRTPMTPLWTSSRRVEGRGRRAQRAPRAHAPIAAGGQRRCSQLLPSRPAPPRRACRPAAHGEQVMLRSRALEITVESCLSSPPAAEHAADLQRLLAAFLPAPTAAAPLVAAVSRLAALLADDASSFDTLGAAQRAVHALIGSLKAEEPAAAAAGGGGAAARLAAVDRDMAKEQGFLTKVSQGGVTK
jgi:hypothetical protein